MKRWQISLGLTALTLIAAALAPRLLPYASTTTVAPERADGVVERDEPQVTSRRIDIVLALDTSGSMDNLLDSTRSRLWDIVNTLDAEDPNAELRVGLMVFGSPSYGAESGFVQVATPLTTNLDEVYEAAFALTTRGGDEYVGSTIHTAIESLDWVGPGNPDDRRLLFIAGNEASHQGPHDAENLAEKARDQGILVSTLFAGQEAMGRRYRWDEVAARGGGKFLAIDAAESNRAVATTPYDADIERLNEAMNNTYVAYGKGGAVQLDRMRKNDASARKMGAGSLVSRATAKAGRKYKTDGWDLIAATKSGKVDAKSLSERQQAEVAAKAAKRASVKREMEELRRAREQHLRAKKEESKRARPDADAGLDEAMTEALNELL